MPENITQNNRRKVEVRHRGRGSQVLIYFSKLLRMFVYQNDWKVLPMAALIAGLVGMVIRNRFFINMEGSLMGSFALVCVCIWNGCFNSIQVICRERDVIKREHRSGMHISSYIFSHMLYQALLCLGQTIVTFYVTQMTGVQYPSEGKVLHLFMVEFMISMFLITYASDMLSLWISALAHTTTTAMTIMPFVLIFQLVFSGGMLTLPQWAKPITSFTISNPGLKVIACQADTNQRPYATIASMLSKMGNSEVGGTVSVGQVMDLLQDEEIPAISQLRAIELVQPMTAGELMDQVVSPVIDSLLDDVGLSDRLELLDAVDASGALDEFRDRALNDLITAGEVIDLLADSEAIQARREESITVSATLGQLMDLAGKENVMAFLEEKAAEANYEPAYEYTAGNVAEYWMRLILFAFVFALLAMITLEFIDKDKR